jgi:hypothetical protein
VGCVFFWGKRKKKRRNVWLVFMCGRCCSWKRCVQELSMEKFPWQSPWSFISNSWSSQIHHWICVKLQTVLV